MAGPLAGLTILVPESRELDLFVRLLEAEGAAAVRCPLVQILDLEDISEAEAWIEQLIAGMFQDVIWLTGEGLRRLLPIAERNSAPRGVCRSSRPQPHDHPRPEACPRTA